MPFFRQYGQTSSRLLKPGIVPCLFLCVFPFLVMELLSGLAEFFGVYLRIRLADLGCRFSDLRGRFRLHEIFNQFFIRTAVGIFHGMKFIPEGKITSVESGYTIPGNCYTAESGVEKNIYF
jgi:hypothetical protein